MPAVHEVYPQLPGQHSARQVRRRLLAWFHHAQRDLPWRQDRDPYRIWVSEVMLQQTQVATVIPFFERFLRAFPDLQSLASASEQEVLKAWEGLGYYRRARDLHRAAQRLCEYNGGQVPDNPDAFGNLPGVGRYTVGAVLSMAFDRRLPIVEANSARVLCRLFACPGPTREARAANWLWECATRLLPRRRVGEFNQALMELGALVCTARQPCCEACPISSLCSAHARGLQESIPKKETRRQATRVQEVALVIRRGDRLLLVQRPARATRWANMWEFPHDDVRNGEPLRVAARRILEATGLCCRLGPQVATVEHTVTRFRIQMRCFRATYLRGAFRSVFYGDHAWVRLRDVPQRPLSTPQREIVELLRKHQ